jgi:hypothetical protein
VKNAKMSQHMTLLGLCAMVFYGAMLASGVLSLADMPQFLVSAIIFLTAGRYLRVAARAGEDESEAPVKPKKKRPEPDWPWLTALLNWTAALLVIGVMAILLMKPVGLSWKDAISETRAHEHYYGAVIP